MESTAHPHPHTLFVFVVRKLFISCHSHIIQLRSLGNNTFISKPRRSSRRSGESPPSRPQVAALTGAQSATIVALTCAHTRNPCKPYTTCVAVGSHPPPVFVCVLCVGAPGCHSPRSTPRRRRRRQRRCLYDYVITHTRARARARTVDSGNLNASPPSLPLPSTPVRPVPACVRRACTFITLKCIFIQMKR